MCDFFSLSPGKGKPLDTDSGAITNSTEEEHLLEMGKPRLGDVTKIKIHIKESQEFKVKCHECVCRAGVGEKTQKFKITEVWEGQGGVMGMRFSQVL